MNQLLPYYSLATPQQLELYLQHYVPLVIEVAKGFSLDVQSPDLKGDHVGVQVLTSEEFNMCSDVLQKYAQRIRESVIHERRNCIFEFNTPFIVDGIEIPRIEIFEPKPNVDVETLRAGIEHVAFTVESYDSFLKHCQSTQVPIAKAVEKYGSKFFKTSLINNVEIEFRNDRLGYLEQSKV